MPIPKQSLSLITEADLQALVIGAAREDKTLEFKRDAYGKNDDAKSEFLADVSAFANTAGGDLVIGMDEVDGAASSLVGLADGIDPDAEILRLQQMAVAGLQPALPSFDAIAVPLSSGRHAVVVRVGRSYLPPHRVIFNRRNRFWVRGPAGRFEPDVEGLRTLFAAGPALARRIRELRNERVRAILSGETPVPVRPEAGLFNLQLIPFASIDASPIALNEAQLERQLSAFAFLRVSGFNTRMTFDGFVAHQPIFDGASMSYALLDRRGFVEVVTEGILASNDHGKRLFIDEVAAHIVHHVRRILPLLRTLGPRSPVAVLVDLIGMRDAHPVRMQRHALDLIRPASSLNRDVLTFVDAVIAEEAVESSALVAAVRPILEQLAQTAGLSTIPVEWTSGK